MAVVALRVTVLDRAFDPSLPVWGDSSGAWEAAPAWAGLLAAAGVPFTAADDPAGDDGEGLLVVPTPGDWEAHVDRAADRGRPLLTGPPPASPADALAAVRRGLGALVRPDLTGVVVLRLDDPGASVRRHLSSWAHDDVEPKAWDALWEALAGFGRVSVFCCPGWVDDDGTVSPSRRRSPAEWAALDVAVGAGVADLECHGYTHVHPDLARWGAAPDRGTNPDWYREMWPPGEAAEPSAESQGLILRSWQEACGPGSALVAPGECWGLNTVAAARRAGFALFNSWGVCRLDLPVPTWASPVGSPYLDRPDPAWLADGLPTVAYWHDRDMAVHGAGWAPGWLDAWRDCGARRAWAFSDLARAWSAPVDAALVDGDVVVRSGPPVPLLVEREP